jgi:UDP-N-acetylmuramoyl-L-alanyl-D-glutamate--2,6-diaminopimelate ligase
MSKLKRFARKVIPEDRLHDAEEAYRLQKSNMARRINGNPAKHMHVIGVTGTNGKTTTSSFINEILKAGGKKTAVYTTAFIEIAGVNKPNRTHMTVASAWAVQRFLRKAKREGVEWVILEVTSHALDQHRIKDIPIEIAVVTNLSQDHLDYHKTMENYAAAKARLITEFNPKSVILNADDEWFEYFGRKVKNKLLTVGQGKASHQIKSMKLGSAGTEYSLVSPTASLALQTHLVGAFNVYNSAMAAAVGQVVGITAHDIEQGVANVPVVPGRLEAVNAGQNFTVLVDYAHTADALENVLKAVHSVANGKVRVVFGATGDRDKSKRGPMGRVAAENADIIYLTDDETYTEDGEVIRAAVRQGVIEAGAEDRLIEIADRAAAIKRAFTDAQAGDVVLLAGIGHQNYRAMGGKKIPWDERIVAEEILRSI